MKKDRQKPGFLRAVFVAAQFAVTIVVWLKPGRLIKFMRGQRREIRELKQGDEDVKRFLSDSGILLKNLFIPNVANDHKPTILHPRTLTTFAAIAIAVKVLVTSFLFVTYPSPAELSAIVSSTMVKLINESRIESGAEPVVEDISLGTGVSTITCTPVKI